MITFAVAGYNVEGFIASCLDSIIMQTRDEFELLIIDDGSTDNTGIICDKYAKNDNRIRVIHQENSGISCVRNLAIHEARGEWLCFVDGDDRLAEGAYNSLVSEINDNYDIIYFDMQYFIYDKAIPSYNISMPPLVVEGDDIRSLQLATLYEAKGSAGYTNKCLRSLCAKAFRVDFLRKNALTVEEELAYAEDVVFKIDCLKFCKRVKFVRKPFYLYRRREDSAIHKYNPAIKDRILTLNDKIQSHIEGDEELTKRFYMDYLRNIRLVLSLDMCHRNNKKSYDERKKDFYDFISLPCCEKAICNVDTSALQDKDLQWYEILKSKNFKKLCAEFKKRDTVDDIKRIAGRTGLIKIIKPLKDKLKK